MKRTAAMYADAIVRATADRSREETRVIVERLTQTLQREGHAQLLPKILARAEEALLMKGKMRLHVTSARRLSETEKEALLSSLAVAPASVLWDEHIDPAVGVGARVAVGDRVVTWTAASLGDKIAAVLSA